MERRRADRRSVDLTVVLSYRQLGLVSCRALDASREGMHVESGVVAIPKGAYVKVHLSIKREGRTRTFATGALVAWSARGNLGLVFQDPAPEMGRELDKFQQWGLEGTPYEAPLSFVRRNGETEHLLSV